jgi:hypothetical protein
VIEAHALLWIDLSGLTTPMNVRLRYISSKSNPYPKTNLFGILKPT